MNDQNVGEDGRMMWKDTAVAESQHVAGKRDMEGPLAEDKRCCRYGESRIECE
jgi:hypothetical protein